MRRPTSPAAGWPAVAWLAWAAGIVPVMFILPPYLFPFPAAGLDITVYDGRRYLQLVWAAGLLLGLLWPPVRLAVAALWLDLSVWVRAATAVFVGWALLSAVVSSAPAYALREWSLVTLLVVAFLPLRAMVAGRHARLLEVTGLTLVLYAVTTFASPLDHGFQHPRILGDAVAVTAPALLFSGNPVLALMGAPALALGILNGTRALLVTLLVVTAAALLLWPDRRRRMVPGLMGLAVAAGVVALLAWLGHDASLQEAAERGTTLTGRDRLWRDSFGRFLGAPILGVGPGLLARAPGLANWAASPHNTVLLVAGETGVVGLAAIGVLVARGVRRLPGLAADHRPWALVLLAGAVQSMFSGTVLIPICQVLLLVALALAWPVAGGAAGGGSAAGVGSDGPGGEATTGWPDRGRQSGWARGVPWGLALVGVAAVVILLATLSLPPTEATPNVWPPRFFSRGMIP